MEVPTKLDGTEIQSIIMYSLLLKAISFFGHPRRFLKSHSLIALSKIRITGNNILKTDHTIIRQCTISVSGNNNVVDLGQADIFNSAISISGTDTRLCIHDAARIYNMHIIIKNSVGGYIEIGSSTHLGGGTIVCAGNNNYITIGNNCMIAENVEIWNSDTHVITYQGGYLNNDSPIQIHNHVWLGKGVTVLKGVVIGENAIVGMKSLVTKNINPNTINAGIPSKEIRDQVNWRK